MSHPLEGTFKMDNPPSKDQWTKKEPPLEYTFVILGPPLAVFSFSTANLNKLNAKKSIKANNLGKTV